MTLKKYLILVSSVLLTSSLVSANCGQKPKPKKPACKPKIVTVERPIITEKVVVVEKPVIRERVVVKRVQKKNRISLLGGMGPTRLEKNAPDVNLLREPVGGLQYQRMLNSSLSVGVQIQTNETVLGSIGLDF